jgi:hypothetical protein
MKKDEIKALEEKYAVSNALWNPTTSRTADARCAYGHDRRSTSAHRRHWASAKAIGIKRGFWRSNQLFPANLCPRSSSPFPFRSDKISSALISHFGRGQEFRYVAEMTTMSSRIWAEKKKIRKRTLKFGVEVSGGVIKTRLAPQLRPMHQGTGERRAYGGRFCLI